MSCNFYPINWTFKTLMARFDAIDAALRSIQEASKGEQNATTSIVGPEHGRNGLLPGTSSGSFSPAVAGVDVQRTQVTQTERQEPRRWRMEFAHSGHWFALDGDKLQPGEKLIYVQEVMPDDEQRTDLDCTQYNTGYGHGLEVSNTQLVSQNPCVGCASQIETNIKNNQGTYSMIHWECKRAHEAATTQTVDEQKCNDMFHDNFCDCPKKRNL